MKNKTYNKTTTCVEYYGKKLVIVDVNAARKFFHNTANVCER